MAPRTLPSSGLPNLLLLFVFLIAIFPHRLQAQDTSNSTTSTLPSPSPSPTWPSTPTLSTIPTVTSGPHAYTYAGCFNETTLVANTSGARALSGGIEMTAPGTLTVAACVDFCARNTSTAYALAGLEYSRECYCARALSSLSARLPDAACDTPCDGDNATACGGALRLSVYNLTADSGQGSVAVGRLRGGGGGVLGALGVVGVVWGAGWALGCL
ncbi:hypothetical protein F4779DRAFT_613533 [Xylariaceae sp. FL0662B]|nr:hypothetical protein F4779DRAFT_613533 [Xylariaceae sp. FL0662B]